MFDGPGTRQVIARGTKAEHVLVTVVLTHRVPEERADEFQAWRKEIVAAESKFPGFRGAQVFRPVEGLQDEWTVCYRFDTAEHLDAWLISDARKQLLRHPHFRDFKMRKIDQSFGNWFAFGDETASPPSDFKTSVAVRMGLYPTVVLLTLLITPLHLDPSAHRLNSQPAHPPTEDRRTGDHSAGNHFSPDNDYTQRHHRPSGQTAS